LKLPTRLLCAIMATATSACGGPTDSPEERIRELLDRIEQTTEQGKALGFNDYIATDYDDADGRRQRDVLRLIAGYKLRHRSIHLLVHIADIQVAPDGQTGSARIFVGMAGRPVASVDQLNTLQADLFRFDLRLRTDSDGEFQISGAAWQRARQQDFLPGADPVQ